MLRIEPATYLYILIVSLLLFFLLKGVEIANLLVIDPIWYQLYGLAMVVVFSWWPIDLLVNWDKRTLASYEKDKYLLGGILAIIAYVGLAYFGQNAQWLSAVTAVGVGALYPVAVLTSRFLSSQRIDILPETVQTLALQSPRAQEFLHYFPHARQYAYGFSLSDHDRAHLILHHRENFNDAPAFQIDYVLDVPVDSQAKIYIGNRERLHCYLFANQDEHARIGFLPSANIGRALDYGFSDDEVDTAIEEANNIEQNFPALDDKPLIIKHHPGRVVKLK